MTNGVKSKTKKGGIRLTDIQPLLAQVQSKSVSRELQQFFLNDMDRFIGELKDIEERLANGRENRSVIWQQVNGPLTQLIERGDRITAPMEGTSLAKDIKDRFRHFLAPWLYQGVISRRGYEKPRGYAGDYKAIEMFYDQTPLAEKGIGYYFDKYVISNPLAKADIGRKDKMKAIIEATVESFSDDKVNVINFGCGGCKELRDLFASYSPTKAIALTAIDQDTEALQFSKQCSAQWPRNVRAKFVPVNIIELVKEHRADDKTPFHNFHLAYSIGLVDYFADNVLQLFVRFCLKALRKDGKFVFAHKNSKRWKSYLAADWLCDWRFYRRDLPYVFKILEKEIEGCHLEIQWEKTSHMFFLILFKISKP